MRRTTQLFVASRPLLAPTLFHPGASRPRGASGGCRMRPPRAVPRFSADWTAFAHVALCRKTTHVRPAFILGFVRSGACLWAAFLLMLGKHTHDCCRNA